MASEKFRLPPKYRSCEENVWMEYSDLARKYKPLNLGQGAPDFTAPKILTDALEEVSKIRDDPILHQYTRGFGHPRLVNILSKIFSPLINKEIHPMDEIMIANGATEALYCAIIGVIDVGDEVIIMEPFFDFYEYLVKMAEGTPRYIPLRPKKDATSSSDWSFDFAGLVSLFNPKTKMIIVNSPHNPTGKVFTAEELQQIADLCIKWDVLCISDEVYEWMIYKPSQHLRIAALPGMWSRTLTIGSAGKTFSATGWKIGWAFGPSSLLHNLRVIHQNCVYCCCSPLQDALARVFESEEKLLGTDKSFFTDLVQTLEKKRDFLSGVLKEVGMEPMVPDGGYFMLADWEKIGMEPGKYALMVKDMGPNMRMEYEQLEMKYNCISLGLGCPDYGAPKIFTQALEEVAKCSDPEVHQYTLESGHPRLVNILSKLYSPQFKRKIEPSTEIIVTNSATEAIYYTMINFLKPRDEVIIIEPYYNRYDVLTNLAEGIPRYIPLRPKKDAPSSSDWVLDKKELESKFNSKTKIILLNTPHNPTGKIFTLEELQHIAELCIKWNVLCIADEVYEWIVYKPGQHLRIATLPGMWDRTITICSAGKTFGATGWRLGWCFGAPKLIYSLLMLHQNSPTVCNTPLQEAIARALEREEQSLGKEGSYLTDLPNILMKKRDIMVKALTEVGMTCNVPNSGIFILANWTKLEHKADMESETDDYRDFRFTKWMCKNLHVQFYPLSAYYSQRNKHIGENFVRVCFLKKIENLEKATSILENWAKT